MKSRGKIAMINQKNSRELKRTREKCENQKDLVYGAVGTEPFDMLIR
jgi:hypothetical protein